MTMTKQELENIAVSKAEVNTNNDWGFGGWSGTAYTLNGGVVVKKGKASFRHLRPEAIENWVAPNGVQIDAPKKGLTKLVYGKHYPYKEAIPAYFAFWSDKTEHTPKEYWQLGGVVKPETVNIVEPIKPSK